MWRPGEDGHAPRRPCRTRCHVLTDERTNRVLDGIAHLVWDAQPDGTTRYLNSHALRYFGWSPNATGDWLTRVHPAQIDGARAAWDSSLRAATPLDLDCELRRADGVYRWHAITARPVADGDGVVRQWIGVAVDVDDARQMAAGAKTAQRAAQESGALLQTLYSNAPVGLGFVDRDFRRVLVNQTLAEYNGSTVADQIGRRVPDLVPSLWPKLEPMYSRVLDTGDPIVDVEVAGPSEADLSEDRHWLNSYYPVTVEGDVIGVGVVAVEITDRARTAQNVQRLAAIVEIPPMPCSP